MYSALPTVSCGGVGWYRSCSSVLGKKLQKSICIAYMPNGGSTVVADSL
jgi:hypothetical protein